MKPEQKFSPEGENLIPLIERAKAGDQQAYSALYEATEREVYRTVRAMIRSEELARDVQQEVYVYAFTHLDSLREPEKLRAWLRGIAVNQSHTDLRQVTPVLFSELENGEGAELPELPDFSGDAEPELTLERRETARYVNEILDDLTDGQRAVVAMYYYEQLPVSEIARDLGVTPGTVKTQLFRSRKKIESAVRRLEERGVKLLGLAPLPFLLALLKRLTPAAEGSRAALRGTLTRAGLAPAAQAAGTAAGTTAAGTAASVAGTAVTDAAASFAGTAVTDAAASFAGTAAVHVGRSFFETVLGKVVLGLITAAAIGGGVMGWNWYQNHINIGDVRPTETLEINLRYDSDEDLTTEPTAETDTEPVTTAAPETDEDLVPVTTEPEESTEPIGQEDPTETTEPPAPTDPAPTDPQPTNPTPQPTQPTPQPADPVPAVPTEPDPTTEPTEIGNVGTTLETLPTTNPYPESLGTVYLQKTADGVWIYSYQTDVEMEVSQFVFSNAQISNILVSSAYANGTQTITVNLSYAGTCTIGIRIPDFYWYKLVTLIIQDSDE